MRRRRCAAAPTSRSTRVVSPAARSQRATPPLPSRAPISALGRAVERAQGADAPALEDLRVQGRRLGGRERKRREEGAGVADDPDRIRAPGRERRKQRGRRGADPCGQAEGGQFRHAPAHLRLGPRRIRALQVDGAASRAGVLDARGEGECRREQQAVGLDLGGGLAPAEHEPRAAGHREGHGEARNHAAWRSGLGGDLRDDGVAALAGDDAHRAAGEPGIAPAQRVKREIIHAEHGVGWEGFRHGRDGLAARPVLRLRSGQAVAPYLQRTTSPAGINPAPPSKFRVPGVGRALRPPMPGLESFSYS